MVIIRVTIRTRNCLIRTFSSKKECAKAQLLESRNVLSISGAILWLDARTEIHRCVVLWKSLRGEEQNVPGLSGKQTLPEQVLPIPRCETAGAGSGLKAGGAQKESDSAGDPGTAARYSPIAAPEIQSPDGSLRRVQIFRGCCRSSATRCPGSGTDVIIRITPYPRLTWFACVSCAILLNAVCCPAQDALRSAVAVDSLLQQSALPIAAGQRDLPHLGPVQLVLGAHTGLEFNDNVNTSESNPQSDLLFRGGLDLGLHWAGTMQSQIQFGSSVGFVRYAEHSNYDHLEVAPNSALEWTISFDTGSIVFFDQLTYSQEVIGEAALSGLATFPLLNNTIGTRLNWLPGHWAFEAGYSHQDSGSDAAQFDYLNSSSEYVFARAGWRFAEKTTVGLETSVSVTSYEKGTQSGNYSVSLGPYADWQLTENLGITFHGGPVFYVFDSSPAATQGKDLHSFYLSLEINEQLTDFLSQRLTVQRTVRQGLNQGSDYVQQLGINYGAYCSITPRISLGAGIAYEQGNQPFLVPIAVFPFGTFLSEQIEYYDRYGATLSGSWKATDRLTAALVYNHWIRGSNIAGNDYSVNSIAATLTYSF